MDDQELIAENFNSLRFWAAALSSRLPQALSFDDLLMAGICGLLAAKSKHDPQKSSPKTYFDKKIRGAVLDEIRKIRPGSRAARDFEKAVYAAKEDLRERYGREPSFYELADELGITQSSLVRRVRALPVAISSLEQQWGKTVTLRIEENVTRQMEYEEVVGLLDLLSHRERYVLNQYFFEGRSLRAIGRDLHITESRVCQIKQGALARLRSLYRPY